MNSKMTTNSQLSTTKPKKIKNKNELSKQVEQEQIHRNGDHMEGYQQGGGQGKMREKVQEMRSIICGYKRQEEVKSSIGNGEVKELTCTTHGHELRGWNSGWKGGCRVEGDNGERKWDNCNSIINKIYLKRYRKRIK